MAKKRLPKYSQVDPVTQDTVKRFIDQNEFGWWCNRASISEARRATIEATGLSITAPEFRELTTDLGWYRNPDCPRRQPSSVVELQPDGFYRLRCAVIELRGSIFRVGIGVAVAIVSTEVPCNERLLDGLTKEIHFWEPSFTPRAGDPWENDWERHLEADGTERFRFRES